MTTAQYVELVRLSFYLGVVFGAIGGVGFYLFACAVGELASHIADLRQRPRQ